MLKLLTVSALLVATLFLGVVFTARAQVAPNQNQILLPGYWGGGFLISTSSAASTKLGTSLVDLAGSWVSGILPISRGGTGTSTPPADGQLLIGNAGGTWDYIASSTLAVLTNYWTKSGTNLYYTAGNVGIGTSAPTHALTFPQSSTGIALYNTADQTTNYERVRQYWDSNSYKISVEAGGTGSSNRQLEISGGGGAARLSQSGQVSGSFSLSRSTSGSGFSAGQGLFNLFGTHTQTAGTMVGQLIGYTISQSGTAGYTALLINPTESSIGSGNRRLIDAQVGGTSRFVVESGGNVGIGTTTPGSMLDVNGDISFATGKNIGRTDLNITTDTTQSFFYGIKRANADARFNGMKVYNNANGAGGLPASRIGFYTDKTGLSASTERMTITEDGNVGIGTTSPAAKLHVTNTTDAASNQAAIFESDRATPTANDSVYVSFKLSDSAGNQDEFGRINLQGTDVTSTSEDARFVFRQMIAGTPTDTLTIEGGNIRPATGLTYNLGSTGAPFANNFLASGGVINWNNGDVTLTHSAGVLTASADLRITTPGTNSTSVPTLGSTSTLTNKILSHTVEPGTDDTFTGEQITGFNATATIAQWEAVYLSTTGWALTDADAAATAGGVMVGLAAAAGTNGNPLTVVTKGVIRNDGWTWTTVGAPLYLSTTAGAITQTAPSGTDDVVRIIGYVLSDDCIYLNPSNDFITRV